MAELHGSSSSKLDVGMKKEVGMPWRKVPHSNDAYGNPMVPSFLGVPCVSNGMLN